jgi:hypothetical protein
MINVLIELCIHVFNYILLLKFVTTLQLHYDYITRLGLFCDYIVIR